MKILDIACELLLIGPGLYENHAPGPALHTNLGGIYNFPFVLISVKENATIKHSYTL